MARKHKRNPQSPLALVLMGKGQLKKVKPVACRPWQGMLNPSLPLFDEVQAKKNKKAGFCE